MSDISVNFLSNKKNLDLIIKSAMMCKNYKLSVSALNILSRYIGKVGIEVVDEVCGFDFGAFVFERITLLYKFGWSGTDDYRIDKNLQMFLRKLCELLVKVFAGNKDFAQTFVVKILESEPKPEPTPEEKTAQEEPKAETIITETKPGTTASESKPDTVAEEPKPDTEVVTEIQPEAETKSDTEKPAPEEPEAKPYNLDEDPAKISHETQMRAQAGVDDYHLNLFTLFSLFYESNQGFYHGAPVHMKGDESETLYHYLGQDDFLYDIENFKTVRTYIHDWKNLERTLAAVDKRNLVFLRHADSGEVVPCNKNNVYPKSVQRKLASSCLTLLKDIFYKANLKSVLQRLKTTSEQKYFALLTLTFKNLTILAEDVGPKDPKFIEYLLTNFLTTDFVSDLDFAQKHNPSAPNLKNLLTKDEILVQAASNAIPSYQFFETIAADVKFMTSLKKVRSKKIKLRENCNLKILNNFFQLTEQDFGIKSFLIKYTNVQAHDKEDVVPWEDIGETPANMFLIEMYFNFQFDISLDNIWFIDEYTLETKRHWEEKKKTVFVFKTWTDNTGEVTKSCKKNSTNQNVMLCLNDPEDYEFLKKWVRDRTWGPEPTAESDEKLKTPEEAKVEISEKTPEEAKVEISENKGDENKLAEVKPDQEKVAEPQPPTEEELSSQREKRISELRKNFFGTGRRRVPKMEAGQTAGRTQGDLALKDTATGEGYRGDRKMEGYDRQNRFLDGHIHATRSDWQPGNCSILQRFKKMANYYMINLLISLKKHSPAEPRPEFFGQELETLSNLAESKNYKQFSLVVQNLIAYTCQCIKNPLATTKEFQFITTDTSDLFNLKNLQNSSLVEFYQRIFTILLRSLETQS